MMTPCKRLSFVKYSQCCYVLSYIALSKAENVAGKHVEIPAFVTPGGGLNNGFMIAHCTSAALGEHSLSD